MKLNNFMWVFIGGGLGSVIRFLFSQWILKSEQDGIPMATLLANVLACIFMALTFRFLSPHSETTRLFLCVHCIFYYKYGNQSCSQNHY